jgi:hypothetical protein
MQRTLALFLAVVFGAALLTGCGKQDIAPPEPTEAANAEGTNEEQNIVSEYMERKYVGDKKIVGTWIDSFGNELTYNADGTFENWGVINDYSFDNGILVHYGDAFDTINTIVFKDNNKALTITQTEPYPLVPQDWTKK